MDQQRLANKWLSRAISRSRDQAFNTLASSRFQIRFKTHFYTRLQLTFTPALSTLLLPAGAVTTPATPVLQPRL
jgi:hypothetical protein